MNIICLFFTKGTPLEFFECCYSFTPRIYFNSEAIFLDIEGCQKLYSTETLIKRLRIFERRFGVSFRIGIASDTPTALAFARFEETRKADLPIEALLDYASPLNKEHISEALPMLSLLQRLGVENLSAFLALPSQSLSSRFQRLGLHLHQRVQGLSALPWPSLKKPLRIREEIVIDESQNAQSLEPLLFLLKNPLQRACSRLRGRMERTQCLNLRIETEKYSTVKRPVLDLSFYFSTPQGCSFFILQILKEKLAHHLQRTPLEAPIIHLSIECTETSPAQISQQNLFNEKEEKKEKIESLLERLKAKLGSQKVFQASLIASYIPERSWTRVQSLPSDIDTPLPKRPIRLLKNPIPLERVNNLLIFKGSSMKIVDEEGPERLQGYWWQELFHRDYYTTTVQSGETLWIYQQDASGPYYLHGLFD